MPAEKWAKNEDIGQTTGKRTEKALRECIAREELWVLLGAGSPQLM